MSSKIQKDKAKNVQEKYQMVLSRLLREENNKYCADCDAKGPRWASWNLGVFLCIRCAGIHRNLGVHVSKVKSVNLDTWTEEQILSVENGGNTLGRKIYEKHLPSDFRRPTADSNSLENFIRAKYERKKYMDKDYVRPAPKTIQVREFDGSDKKEKKNVNSAAARHKQQTLVALAKSREAVPRPHPSGLQPSTAASLSSSLSQSSPNLAAETQPPTSLPSTPVKTVASANDLLGLYMPPANNVNDLLGLNPPPAPTSGSQSVTSNGTPEGTVETSLFGDDAEVAGSGGKKTKDSIMALFASSSGQQQPAYNVPGGVYIPSQKQHFAANGYPANSTIPGYQPTQQPVQANAAMTGYQPQPQPQPNIQGYGVMGPQQGVMGPQQGVMGPQQGVMGPQQGMMGPQQGMMGMQGMYGAQMAQQSAYLQQQQQQQQQQFQMMQQQMTQQYQQWQYMQQMQAQQRYSLELQIQQQMNSMRLGGGSNPPQGQMQQPNWQPSNTVIPQQQAVPTAMTGAGSMGGWGGAGSGQTLSNQLWK